MVQPLTRRLFLAATAAVIVAAPAHAQDGLATTPVGFSLLRAKDRRGPAIRVKYGEEVKVRFSNDAAAPSALHWHGVRLANGLDPVPGLSGEATAPGMSRDYRFVPPDAGTFWYRPATTALGESLDGPQGPLVVEELDPPDVDQDITLFIDTIAGFAPRSVVTKPDARLRLRIINATGTPLSLRLARHRLILMALDGQPAEPLATHDGRLGLGPGNRADVFVDISLTAGESADLTAEGEAAAVIASITSDHGHAASTARPEPKALPENPLPKRMDLQQALRSTWSLAGSPPDALGAALFSARRGRTIALALANMSPRPSAVHVHGHSFRLLDRMDDGWKPFWLDTLFVGAGETVRIAFVADNPGRWLIEARASDGRAVTTWFAVS